MSRGRHRKPTHTGRNMAVVATTGAFALPIGAVATAEPASAGILDEIARCESGGRTSVVNGSGHAGLFQFDQQTWASVGGSGSAANASAAEQYRRAQALLASRGTQPWNASKSCWSGKSGAPSVGGSDDSDDAAPKTKTQRHTAPKRTAPKTKVAPRTKTQRHTAPTTGNLGARAADGSGRYVCTQGTLFFDACDPDTLGQVVAYPRYSSSKASAAPSAPVRGQNVATHTAPPASAVAAAVATGARNYLGVAYAWGGASRAGMDCSGLVYRVLMDRGIAAPRTSAGQYAWTRRITAAEAKPGDLVFFYSPVSHVGIVTRPGWMIDSSQPGTHITERRIYPGAKYGRIPG